MNGQQENSTVNRIILESMSNGFDITQMSFVDLVVIRSLRQQMMISEPRRRLPMNIHLLSKPPPRVVGLDVVPSAVPLHDFPGQ
ncbi:hypothetical protein DAPPUDRAFT_241886 [Daphnia pulex]|uniref:Uncharacterized protein n=1 Tax=Daphnia pulex TaxID=6669 RepID=E9GFA7_DAPPU|nr:hypothetical protein DAPPUDRAFT_241886 [Daphnia pulex]|eukprot:EFX81843.1 hypothetical protein DAPPUDRAFT_241886 [Daphnia pulex]